MVGNGGAPGDGGGGGPPSPALGSATNTGSGQNNNQGNARSGTTDPGQSCCVYVEVSEGLLCMDFVVNVAGLAHL